MEDNSTDILAKLTSDELISGREDLDLLYRGVFGVSDLNASSGAPFLYNCVNKMVAAIANDLNTKQFHFLLELLQNCSDNLYADGVQPSAQLSLLSPSHMPDLWKRYAPHGALIVRNNEIGFRRKDLFSLSQASMSSKENLRGFIGQKGMGFKCVFVASAKPHIVSGNLQVFFSDEIEHSAIPLKFLPPFWIEDEEFVASLRESAPEKFQGGTTIFLPLRTDQIREQLSVELRSMTFTTLMFLPKLSSIEIVEDDCARVLRFEQEEEPFLTTTVETNGIAMDLFNAVDMDDCEWIVCTSEADMSGIEEPSRSSESFNDYRPVVSLAFPVSGELQRQVRETSTLIAFLPTVLKTRTACFINSDFLLTASRDTIKDDNAWNQRLLQSAAVQFAAFLEVMVHRSQECIADMKHWIQAAEWKETRSDVNVVIQKHFIKPAVQCLKSRRICMISSYHIGGERVFLKPEESVSFPKPALKLLEACQSQPDSLPDTILDIGLLGSKNSVIHILHALGVDQRTSFDFFELFRKKLKWAQQEALSDDWILMLINWLQNNFPGRAPDHLDQFVKQVLPLEPVETVPNAPVFASPDSKIYLLSEANQCQRYCPISVGRVVKTSLASELVKVGPWLAKIGAASITFTDLEFACQMCSGGYLKDMAKSNHFVEVSCMIGHIFFKHRCKSDLKRLLVKTAGGEVIEFADSYCESEIQELKHLWQGSTDAAWISLPKKALHSDYAKYSKETLSKLSASWHQLCDSGTPSPPDSVGCYLLPPTISAAVALLSLKSEFESIYAVYKNLLRDFVAWIRKTTAQPFSIEPHKNWVLTNKGFILCPQLTFDRRPAFDADGDVPCLHDDDLRHILRGIKFASPHSNQTWMDYFNTMRSSFPEPNETVAKWFDIACSAWLCGSSTSKPSWLPNFEHKRWESQWQVSAVVDREFNSFDDLLRQCRLRNWAHPKFMLPKCSQALLRHGLKPLTASQIAEIIISHGDAILHRLKDIYKILGNRLSTNIRAPGEWIRCHGAWRSSDELFWEPIPSKRLGPYPEAFADFHRFNIATDPELTNISNLSLWLKSEVDQKGPGKQHIFDAMAHVHADSVTYPREKRLIFTDWAYSALINIGARPELLLSESGSFYPARQIFIPSSKWTLSESCAAKVPIAALADRFGKYLSAWGVQHIDQLVKAPRIISGAALSISSEPKLKSALDLLPNWFFHVLRAYIKKIFPAAHTERIQQLSIEQVAIYEHLQRSWEFKVADIQVNPEPIKSCFMNGNIYISAPCVEASTGFIELIVATVLIGVLKEIKPSELREASNFMKCCLFKHSLQPQTAESCMEDLSDSRLNVDLIAKQL